MTLFHRDGGSGWASRAMALLCFRLVWPEYALCLFQIVVIIMMILSLLIWSWWNSLSLQFPITSVMNVQIHYNLLIHLSILTKMKIPCYVTSYLVTSYHVTTWWSKFALLLHDIFLHHCCFALQAVNKTWILWYQRYHLRNNMWLLVWKINENQYEGSFLTAKAILSGVPQSSVLGPLLMIFR